MLELAAEQGRKRDRNEQIADFAVECDPLQRRQGVPHTIDTVALWYRQYKTHTERVGGGRVLELA
eukprot:COSAG05_NODE_24108_length_252_cov_2.441558_1_plen_64_part_01